MCGHALSLLHVRPSPLGPRALLPNALTIGRLVLVPVFAVLLIHSDNGKSWAAGIVFGIAGVTDQIDGWLARRWHVESRFGKSPTRSPTG